MQRFAVILIFRLVVPVQAWNATGHQTIALMVYGQLTPATEIRVDRLLSQHPDYPKWTAGTPMAERGRVAFLAASVWPDMIRSDPRFHADNEQATPNIPGLPLGVQARYAADITPRREI